MCVATAYLVVDVPDPATAVVTRHGSTSTVSLLAADGVVHAGDWVLVHSGLVLARLTDDDVRQLEDLAVDGGLT
jgi:hydrogenase maturation factor